MSQRLKFMLGEHKYVQFKITSKDGSPVIITDAVYELKHNGEVIDTGDCEILESSMMRMLIAATEVGTIELNIQYKIAPEIRKLRYFIDVD